MPNKQDCSRNIVNDAKGLLFGKWVGWGCGQYFVCSFRSVILEVESNALSLMGVFKNEVYWMEGNGLILKSHRCLICNLCKSESDRSGFHGSYVGKCIN